MSRFRPFGALGIATGNAITVARYNYRTLNSETRMHSRRELANAIRALSMDAVERASSGHPGAPMGLADVAEVLWHDFLRHNPKNPNWADRDRFILSNGHGSMLLYSVLHLTGYDLDIEDIKNFRQLNSPTAGHPEYGECPGIETTTGPLGQGFANAVGMAIATTRLAEEFNRPDFPVVNHNIWVCVGDGCLMEGISHEAASLAGTLRLRNLIAIYDDNGVSIDGETKHWFTEDVPNRFDAYGWRVIRDVDGHDADAIQFALKKAQVEDSRPTLICCKTTIGYGSPNKGGQADAHGAPLGADEVALARDQLDWHHEPFDVPDSIKKQWSTCTTGEELENSWNQLFADYQDKYPNLASEFTRRMNGELPENWCDSLLEYAQSAQSEMNPLETRKASGASLDVIGPILPELIGGSADLTGSNNTKWSDAGWYHEGGRHLNFGVREFGMTAIANGIALHGGFLPFTGTFLVFMDYARNAVRLSALMGIRQIFVYTHDSVGLGEDGPTHQPIEHLTNLRTTPNISTWRPCDAVETAAAWREAIERKDGPTALVLTRQKTAPQARDEKTFFNMARGGYVLRRETDALDVVLIATGSEVEVAQDAAESLQQDGVGVRVVSMPSVDRFLEQDDEYQAEVLPPNVRRRVVVEASHPDYWHRFTGLDGRVVGISRYGVSAPGATAMEHLGIHSEAVVEAVREILV